MFRLVTGDTSSEPEATDNAESTDKDSEIEDETHVLTDNSGIGAETDGLSDDSSGIDESDDNAVAPVPLVVLHTVEADPVLSPSPLPDSEHSAPPESDPVDVSDRNETASPADTQTDSGASEEDISWLTPIESSQESEDVELAPAPALNDSDTLSEGFITSTDEETDNEIEQSLLFDFLEESLNTTGIDYQEPSKNLSFEDLYNIAWDHLGRGLTQRMKPRVRNLAHAGGAPKAADYRTMRKRLMALTGTWKHAVRRGQEKLADQLQELSLSSMSAVRTLTSTTSVLSMSAWMHVSNASTRAGAIRERLRASACHSPTITPSH